MSHCRKESDGANNHEAAPKSVKKMYIDVGCQTHKTVNLLENVSQVSVGTVTEHSSD